MVEIALIPKPRKVRVRRGKVYTFASRTTATLPPTAIITTPAGSYRMARRRTVTVPKGSKLTIPEVKPEISPWVLLLPLFLLRR